MLRQRAGEHGVELVRTQFVEQGDGVFLGQREPHVGVEVAVTAQQPLHLRVDARRAGKAHPQFARFTAPGPPRFVGGALHLRRNGLHQPQKGVPGLGEFHPTGYAVKQRRADFTLQFADLLAERRRLNAQPGGGAGHVALVRHRQEIAQVPQLHRNTHSVSQRR